MTDSVLVEVVIFSFNRGSLLRNCVCSVKRLMPKAPVTVFDDLSSNRNTLKTLEAIRSSGIATIIQPAWDVVHGTSSPSKIGGLNRNMTMFLNSYRKLPFVLFLQDDMQLVRAFTSEDEKLVEQFFKVHENAAFLYPAFLTNRACYFSHIDIDAAALGVDSQSFSFHGNYEYSGVWDVCIACADRLISVGWEFGNELESSARAVKLFGPMRLMRYPFVAHLPAPPTCHTRQKSWIQTVWEFLYCGTYPIELLTEPQLIQLRSLIDDYPFAEDFLSSEKYKGGHRWPYTKFQGAPVFLRTLEAYENRFRRALRKCICYSD